MKLKSNIIAICGVLLIGGLSSIQANTTKFTNATHEVLYVIPGDSNTSQSQIYGLGPGNSLQPGHDASAVVSDNHCILFDCDDLGSPSLTISYKDSVGKFHTIVTLHNNSSNDCTSTDITNGYWISESRPDIYHHAYHFTTYGDCYFGKLNKNS